MLLTNPELRDLTGLKRPSAQIRWLRAHSWIFEVGADHRPKILRAYAEQRLGMAQSAPPIEPILHL